MRILRLGRTQKAASLWRLQHLCGVMYTGRTQVNEVQLHSCLARSPRNRRQIPLERAIAANSFWQARPRRSRLELWLKKITRFRGVISSLKGFDRRCIRPVSQSHFLTHDAIALALEVPGLLARRGAPVGHQNFVAGFQSKSVGDITIELPSRSEQAPVRRACSRVMPQRGIAKLIPAA